MKTQGSQSNLEEKRLNLNTPVGNSSRYAGQPATPQEKKSVLSKNEIYMKLLTKHVDFRNEEDLQAIISIIEKDNNSKTQIDLRIIQNALQYIRIFQELSNEIQSAQMFNLFRELRHATFSSRKVVFHQGEIGREFYIILKGSVYIIGNEDKKKEEQTKKDQDATQGEESKKIRKSKVTNSANSVNPGAKRQSMRLNQFLGQQRQSTITEPSQLTQSSNINQTAANEQPKKNQKLSSSNLSLIPQSFLTRKATFVIEEECTDEEYIKMQFPEMDILAKLEAGASFGEVALKDCVPRTATVICSGETHFITLRREAFRRFLDSYYELVQQQNVSFVKEISIFKSWPDSMINQMFFFFEKKIFRMSQIVYKEGSDPEGVYLIREGDIKLYQGISLAYKSEDKLKSIRHFMRNVEIRKPGFFQAPVGHLGAGQMFGSDEIVLEQPRKYTAVVCSSSCTLLFLNKEKFLLFSKRRNTFENAIEESALKENWHSSIVSQLESFKKNQNEHFDKAERDAQKAEALQQSAYVSQSETTIQQEGAASLQKPKQYQEEIFTQMLSQSKIPQTGSFSDYCQNPSDVSTSNQIDTPQSAKTIKLKGNIKNNKSQFAMKKNSESARFQSASVANSPADFSRSKQVQPLKRLTSIISQEQFQQQHSISQIHSPQSISEENKGNGESSQQQQQQQQQQQLQYPEDALSVSVVQRQPTNQIKQSKNLKFQIRIPDQSEYKDQGERIDTIRKFGGEDNKSTLQIGDRLHVPLEMHKNFQQLEDAGEHFEHLPQPCQITLDNQMFQICDNDDPAFKRRVENLYPQIVAYERNAGNKSSSLSSILPTLPFDNIQLQNRIVKSLKLPRIWKNDPQSLLGIFSSNDQQQKKRNKSLEKTELSSNALPHQIPNNSSQLLKELPLGRESTPKQQQEKFHQQGKYNQSQQTSSQKKQDNNLMEYYKPEQLRQHESERKLKSNELTVNASSVFSKELTKEANIIKGRRQNSLEEVFNRMRYAKLIQSQTTNLIPLSQNKKNSMPQILPFLSPQAKSSSKVISFS